MKHRSDYYPLLASLLYANKIWSRDIARLWGISSTAVNKRLAGIANVPVQDAITLQETYFPQYDIKALFSRRLHHDT